MPQAMNSFAPDSYPQNQMASRENNITAFKKPSFQFDEPKHDAIIPDLIESNLGVSRLGWQKGSRTCHGLRRYPKVLCGFMPFSQVQTIFNQLA